ncbi:MAG: acetate kinase [Clostridium sp.]|nr:acetate kinase [Clostridium sp.]
MKILVINCGSSSIKYQFIDMENEKVIAKGLVERIGIKESILTQKVNDDKYVIEKPMSDHKVAIKLVLGALIDETHGVIKSMSEISAVGHRIVHGGEKYAKSVLIDDSVEKYIAECAPLAPLHNPAHVIGIDACREMMPNTPMVAVFDNAFYHTLPDYAYMYALPYDLYKKYGIRKYGFHGTSHKYISREAAKFVNKDIKSLKMVTCHIGNGVSVTAIKNGEAVDTSMGLTPLAGVAMGTRCGDIDPAIVTFLIKNAGMNADEVDHLLNKESGVYGLFGKSDMRDVRAAAAKHDKMGTLAFNIFNYRIKKFIGSYIAAMDGADLLVFTGGIGENSAENREKICSDLDFIGIKLDNEKNYKARGINYDISAPDSRVKVLVIPTDEELMIARDTRDIVTSLK